MSERTAEKGTRPSWWRVVITHGALVKINRARRRFRCEGHIADVAHFIEPGERYVRTSLPPDHPEINNDGWWHMRLCMACCPVEHARVLPPAEWPFCPTCNRPHRAAPCGYVTSPGVGA